MLKVQIPLLEKRSASRQVPISGRTPERDRELGE